MDKAVLAASKPIDTTNRRMRVLAMELETQGHHPSYVRNFAKTWLEYEIPGDLDFLVTRNFLQRHPDVVEYVQSLAKHGIRIHSLTLAEETRMESISYLRYFHGWKLYCQYAKSLQCDHGLLMYSDFFQLPMLVSQPSPCPFSIIYFRPTFHYQQLSNYLHLNCFFLLPSTRSNGFDTHMVRIKANSFGKHSPQNPRILVGQRHHSFLPA